MPTYSFLVTDEQDSALQALASVSGYASVQAFVNVKVSEILSREVAALNAALVSKAQSGVTLTEDEKARVRVLLGL